MTWRDQQGDHMTDPRTLLQLAARCRRLAGLCSTEIVARKFEALALDYEEHAHRMDRGRSAAVPREPGELPRESAVAAPGATSQSRH